MSDIAIRVENLGKRYRIGKRERYRALRDTLTDVIYAPFRRARSLFKPSVVQDSAGADDTIWALKDVSFTIPRGEVVGVIGRNGAGKSTLLKILSRITEPTEGHAEIHGRVGSLLEVGTGFHPELTGRENIYLNGAILGMRRAEIVRKFDEIVAFAEIEKFVDTPVKHFSSGMYMRLAFAVAAHLESEILIVDEVLAVGDSAFQKKCLGKMGDVARGGRTIIFVSHQMNQIRRLCGRVMWLDGGHVQKLADTVEVVGDYELALTSQPLESVTGDHDNHTAAYFLKWEILEPCDRAPNVLTTTGRTRFRFLLKVNRGIRDVHHGIALFNNENQLMWATATHISEMRPGIRELIYTFPGLPLRPGPYQWHLSLRHDRGLSDEQFCSPHLLIGTEPVTHPQDGWTGILNLPSTLQVK